MAQADIDAAMLAAALAEAEAGFAEGGFPVGAVLARGQTILARGRNLSAQTGDPTAHGEVVCLRAARESDFAATTLYTTLSPCIMCAGTVLWLGIPRVVIGDARNYTGNEPMLFRAGIDVIVRDDPACLELFARYTAGGGAAVYLGN